MTLHLVGWCQYDVTLPGYIPQLYFIEKHLIILICHFQLWERCVQVMIHFKFKVAYPGFEAYGSFAELPASWTVEISRSETHVELFEHTFEFSDLY